jgi:thiol-disulfide isomerase/thioredoxin
MKLLLVVSTLLATSTAFQASPPPRSTSARNYRSGPESTAEANHAGVEESVNRLVSSETEAASGRSSRLPNMFSVNNYQEFKEAVQDTSKVTVVRFHAPYCRACKAMAPHFERFAKNHPEINFVQVSYVKSDPEISSLVRRLRVRSVPYGQVYLPEVGLVEEFSFSKKYFSDVTKVIESCVAGLCQLPSDVNEYTKVFSSPYVSLAGQQA